MNGLNRSMKLVYSLVYQEQLKATMFFLKKLSLTKPSNLRRELIRKFNLIKKFPQIYQSVNNISYFNALDYVVSYEVIDETTIYIIQIQHGSLVLIKKPC